MKKFKHKDGSPAEWLGEKAFKNKQDIEEGRAKLTGYSFYPPEDDLFKKGKETEVDPEDISKNKVPKEKYGKRNEKDFEEDESGGDLDVPGSELDDEQEKAGNEDEENNYYSLGGDNHNDLDEDKG